MWHDCNIWYKIWKKERQNIVVKEALDFSTDSAIKQLFKCLRVTHIR